MKNEDNCRTFFSALNEEAQVNLIKNTALAIKRNHAKLVRARDREFSSTSQRNGVRGGLSTTISSNAMNAREAYDDQIEILKFVMTLM